MINVFKENKKKTYYTSKCSCSVIFILIFLFLSYLSIILLSVLYFHQLNKSIITDYHKITFLDTKNFFFTFSIDN